jgi:DNA-binding NarL/FixJ family response regulator
MNRPARILIADDHQLLADACKALLAPEFMVVGTVRDGRHLAVAVDELTPDIVLLNIYLPRLNGLDASEQIRKKTPKIKLVFMSTTPAVDVAAEAFCHGASGYVLKQSGATELLRAVRMVDRGNS